MWDTCVRPATVGSKYCHIIPILDNSLTIFICSIISEVNTLIVCVFTWTYSVSVRSWALLNNVLLLRGMSYDVL